LARLTIPDNVITIGDAAFAGCTDLASLTIPDSVNTIGRAAFNGCTALHDVYFEGNAPSYSVGAFSGASSVIIYYLPGTSGWSGSFAARPTAMWIRVIPATNSVTEVKPLRLLTSSPAPESVRVQRSVNLEDWDEWRTVTRDGGPSELQDNDLGTTPYRFYRGVEE
jgi:hypothetical protein